MTEQLQKKVDYAIKLIRSVVKDETVEVSYSGGKDSDVILELTKMSGVKFRAIYKKTTIDPPGTIKHCRDMGAEILPPPKGLTFFQWIKKAGFPTMRARYCCRELKEYKVLDIAIHGVRRSESTKRSKMYSDEDPVICRIYNRNKKNHVNVILPILSWTDEDVSEFISERGIQCHPLYYDEDGTFHPERRLGCMACPMSQKKAKEDFEKHPKLVKAWVNAGKVWWDGHPNAASHNKFNDIYELFVHNFFYRTYDAFVDSVRNPLNPVDCKRFLEEKYNIKL